MKCAYEEHMSDGVRFWENMSNLKETVFSKDFLLSIFPQLKQEFETWFGDVTGQNGDKQAGYSHGKIIFEIITDIATGGAAGLKKLGSVAKKSLGDILTSLKNGDVRGYFSPAWNGIKDGVKGAKCRLLGLGCFVAGTPALMAGMTAVPIENVSVFDWAMAHTTVNSSSSGLMASAGDNFIGLYGEDPFTSDQQRTRDGYELNNEDWYEVTFEELLGNSYCKLALHKDWMTGQGMEKPGSVHDLNLPEQGIQGPHIITSIKHILPQKMPVDDDPGDDFEYRPVTGIFVHTSGDVLTVRFENGDSLSVTANHPIYSATHHDWRMAGELEAGEKVLSKNGYAVVASKEKLEGEHTVYNLEVRGLHNFLVGGAGAVVHNSCLSWVLKHEIQDAIEFEDLRNSMLNNFEFIPDDWIRATDIDNGIKYISPDDPNNFIRMQRSGNAPGKEWHDNPYYRIADGFYGDGSIKWLDLNGTPSTADFTHFVIYEIDKLID